MESFTSELKVYEDEVRKTLKVKQARLTSLQEYSQRVGDAEEIVKELPNRLSHKVMVPFGKHAFFPGELRHTNELTIHIGGKYHVECTASHAAGVLSRRKVMIERDISEAEAEMHGLHSRLELTSTEMKPGASGVAGGGGEEEAGLFEIRESFEESEALLASSSAPPAAPRSALGVASAGEAKAAPARAPSQDADLERVFARMAELELLEEQGVGDDGSSSGSSRSGSPTGGGPPGSSAALIRQAFTPVPLFPASSSASSSVGTSKPAAARSRPAPRLGNDAPKPLKRGFLVSSTAGPAVSSSSGKVGTMARPPGANQATPASSKSEPSPSTRSPANAGGGATDLASTAAATAAPSSTTASALEGHADAMHDPPQPERQAFTGAVIERSPDAVAGPKPSAAAAAPAAASHHDRSTLPHVAGTGPEPPGAHSTSINNMSGKRAEAAAAAAAAAGSGQAGGEPESEQPVKRVSMFKQQRLMQS